MNFTGISSELTCRLCSEFVAEYSAVQITLDFLAQFQEITSYELSNSPQMSQVICQSCDIKFKDFYTYRQHLIQSQHNLNRLIVPKVRIKVEPMKFPDFNPVILSHLNMFDEVSIDDRKSDLSSMVMVKVEPNSDDELNDFGDFSQFLVESFPLSPPSPPPTTTKIKPKIKREPKLKRLYHYARGGPNRPKSYQSPKECDYCGRHFKIEYTMLQHFGLVHDLLPDDMRVRVKLPVRGAPPQTRQKCPFCCRLFLHDKRLQKHILNRHKNPKKRYYCDLCRYSVTENRFALLMHIKRVHFPHLIESRFLDCKHCDMKFDNPSKLEYHRSTIHRVGEFKCKSCTHVSKNKAEERTHWVKFHKRDRVCEICGHWFSSKDYSAHMKTKNHVYPYTCDVEGCLRAFTTENGLDLHRRFLHKQVSDEHSICPICNRIYPTEQKMKRHMMRTHQTAKIPCPIEGCGYAGKRKEYLKTHLHRTHVELDNDVREMHVRDVMSAQQVVASDQILYFETSYKETGSRDYLRKV